MIRKVIPAQELSIDAPTAARDLYNGNGHVAYPVEDTVAILVCISKGGSRAPQSKKPSTPLWGFTYFGKPEKEMKFVTESALDSIALAVGNGSKVHHINGGMEEVLTLTKR